MLVFDQETGRPLALLQDEGRLTDLRTAAAGAVAARALVPDLQRLDRIAVFGTGIQARLQILHLRGITLVTVRAVNGKEPDPSG